MADFSTDEDFQKMINNILSHEEPATTPFTPQPEAESELVQFIHSQAKTPIISTKIPTRKELQERQQLKVEKENKEGKVQELHFPQHEDIYYKQSEDVNEKVIYVNREKDVAGEVKKDLAIYNIDTDFIQEIRKGVTERIPEVFKNFTPFKHDAQKTAIIKNQIEVLIKSVNNMKVPPSQANVDAIADEIMGLGPLSLLTTLPDVTEIMVVDYDNIYVEMEGILRRVENVKFKDRQHLGAVIERMVGLMGESINFEKPILDMRLSDGSRVNIVGPPITENDSLYLLTIRRFRDTRFTLADLLKKDTISAEMYQYLSNVMKSHANVLLCGGTGSGKTATLEALIMEKDPNECVITVEDTRELMLKRQNWRPMKSKRGGGDGSDKDIDIRQLVKAALRMRPDSIIVGETRDATAYDILFAMNSGHEGCCTTVHANNSMQALSKFEMLAKLAKDEAPPTDALREIIVECFDVVINIGRTPEGQRKIMSVDEVTGYDEARHKYTVMNVFKCIQINTDPSAPSEYKFVSNPEYFTSETLAFKMNRWGLPFVPPKDGIYPSGQSSDINANVIYIQSENMIAGAPDKHVKPKKEKNNKASEWEDVERKAEKARIEAQQKLDREKIRTLKAAQKEASKIKRLQEKDRIRMQQLADREMRNEEKKLMAKANREKIRLERQLRIANEKRERQEALHRERQKSKIVKEMEQEQIKTQREQLQKLSEQKYQEVWDKEYNKLIGEGIPAKEAQKMASLSAISARMEMEGHLDKLNPWKQKNLPKAAEYQRLISQEGLSPEEIAIRNNVSVNNILKYLNIVDPVFVKQYREFMEKNRVKSSGVKACEFLDESQVHFGNAPMVNINNNEENKGDIIFDIPATVLTGEKSTLPVVSILDDDDDQDILRKENAGIEAPVESETKEDLISFAPASITNDKIKVKPIELSADDLKGIL